MRNVVHALSVAAAGFTANACMLEPYDGFRLGTADERVLFFGLAPEPGQGVTLEALFSSGSTPRGRRWTRIGDKLSSPFDTWSSSSPIRPFPDGPALYPWLWEGVIDHQWARSEETDELFVDVRATVGNTSTGFFTSRSMALLVGEPGEGWSASRLAQARVFAPA